MSILVSAGHSRRDSGAVAFGFKEADIVTEFRDMVAAEMRCLNPNVGVVTDGAIGINNELKEVIPLIGDHKIAVEFHCNASDNPKARGVECLSLEKHKWISQLISADIAKITGGVIRGDKGWIPQEKSARGKLGFVGAGGIIVELFFISNPVELGMYRAKKAQLAKAVAARLLQAHNR